VFCKLILLRVFALHSRLMMSQSRQSSADLRALHLDNRLRGELAGEDGALHRRQVLLLCEVAGQVQPRDGALLQRPRRLHTGEAMSCFMTETGRCDDMTRHDTASLTQHASCGRSLHKMRRWRCSFSVCKIWPAAPFFPGHQAATRICSEPAGILWILSAPRSRARCGRRTAAS